MENDLYRKRYYAEHKPEKKAIYETDLGSLMHEDEEWFMADMDNEWKLSPCPVWFLEPIQSSPVDRDKAIECINNALKPFVYDYPALGELNIAELAIDTLLSSGIFSSSKEVLSFEEDRDITFKMKKWLNNMNGAALVAKTGILYSEAEKKSLQQTADDYANALRYLNELIDKSIADKVVQSIVTKVDIKELSEPSDEPIH